MKNELKKELQNAQNNRSFSGVGFQNLAEKKLELEKKLIAVRSDINHTFENVQFPELTRKVKEVLALADEVDPENLYGSDRRRRKYGPLNSYLHSWKRHKEVITECPLSDDSTALLEFIPSLGKLISRNIQRKKVMGEDGREKWIALKEEEITEEMREMARGNYGVKIEECADNIELKCQLFLYNNANTLLKEAKKLGLPVSHSFEFEIKQVFQDERKEYLSRRYKPKYKSHEERLQALFNILISYLGHCQVANYLMNKLTEDSEFTRELLNKAVAIKKKGMEGFCEFLEDFSDKITEKAQSFIMHLAGIVENYIEGMSVDKKRKLRKFSICNDLIAI